MAEINDLNVTDASNTARFPELMLPGAVNDGARALEGILARWHKDTNATLVTLGSSTAYTLTTNRTIAAYYDGLLLGFEASATNTTLTPTLNVDGIGAATLVASGGATLWGGALTSGKKYFVVYNGDAGTWEVINPTKKFRGARVYMASAQSIPDSSLTAISWDSEDFDTDGIHDTVTNNSRLTVPGGAEFVVVNLFGSWASSLAGSQRYMTILKTGSASVATLRSLPVGNTEFAIGSGPISVSGGDYFSVSVFQDSGGALGFGGGSTAFFSLTILQ